MLTDGRLYFGAGGRDDEGLQHPRRARHQDARARRAWPRACSPAAARRPSAARARELGMPHVILGVERQASRTSSALRASSASTPRSARFMGDDLPDAAVLAALRAARSPSPNARRSVKALRPPRHRRPTAAQGAVREFCEFVMRAQGTLDGAAGARRGAGRRR
ncbi:MAG: hypothetical protein MZW92_12010 [Comamonadaceae bacterium]|nr:hypothetical protein [Comamonadaceae bacterium]